MAHDSYDIGISDIAAAHRAGLESLNGAGAGACLDFGMTLRELLAKNIPPRKEVMFGLAKCEIGSLNAITNSGKTTLSRNIAISKAAGRAFPPFLVKGEPKRVAYIDAEATQAEIQGDIGLMISSFPKEEQQLVGENLYIVSDSQQSNRSISYNSTENYNRLLDELLKFDPDLVFIDTVSVIFPVTNENDNAQVIASRATPMREMSRILDAGVMGNHHIGKQKSEDGLSREAAHRGRGASSYADQCKVICNLEKGIADRVTLTLAKIKGRSFVPKILALNPETRWYSVIEGQPNRSNLERTVELFEVGKVYKTAELVTRRGTMSVSGLKANLATGLKQGIFVQPSRGRYMLSL